MNPKVRKIKSILAALPFKTWARASEGSRVWASPEFATSPDRSTIIAETLRAFGYRCELNGTPGTSGEYVVEVFEG